MYYKTNVKYTGRQQTKLGEQSIVYIDNSWKSVYTQNQGTKDEKNYGWALDSARKNPYNSCVAHPGVAQLVARMVRDHEAVGSNPATRTIMNEARFSNIFIEKRASSCPQSLEKSRLFSYPLLMSEGENSQNAKRIFLRKVVI